MIEREYEAACVNGHRGYLRLRTLEAQRIGRCPGCGEDAKLEQLMSFDVDGTRYRVRFRDPQLRI